jgi:hypothetical protein
MFRSLRVLAAAAAFALTFTIATPMAGAATIAAARPTQLNEARAAVGEQWQQILPSGQQVTLEKVDAVTTRTVTPVTMAAATCPGHPYLCVYSAQNHGGSMWMFNMNTVYATTTNGVRHCWNMASAINNNTKSWYNLSDRGAWLYNWVNCNQSGDSFFVGVHEDNNCSQIPLGDWCTVLRPTSIWATA